MMKMRLQDNNWKKIDDASMLIREELFKYKDYEVP